jgi:hypothetical protein
MLLMLLQVPNLKAQAVRYSYDGAGNRVKREKVIAFKTIESDEKQEEEIEEFYEDFVGERKVIIYPNPTKGILKIDCRNYDNIEGMQFSLYDMQGNLLHRVQQVSSETMLDISSYPVGVYLLLLTGEEEKSQWKIVKE